MRCAPHGRVLPSAQRRPAAAPELGPRVRRHRAAPGGRGVGRARGDALAHHPGGRQDRPVRHGLHGQRADGRPDRSHAPGHHGGALLGRRRHRAVDLRLRPGRRRHRRHGDPRAGRGVGAAVLRRRRRREAGRLLRVRARRRLRRELAAHPGRLRRGQGRVGLNGTKAWITNGGIANVHVVVASVDPELKGRGQASFIVPPGTPGLSQGQKYKKHGIRASHTAEVVLDDVRVPGVLPPRRQGAARRQAGQGPRPPEDRREAAGHGHLREHPPGRCCAWPSASPGPPTSTRWTTPRSARRSASRSS